MKAHAIKYIIPLEGKDGILASNHLKVSVETLGGGCYLQLEGSTSDFAADESTTSFSLETAEQIDELAGILKEILSEAVE
ncbi:MAG: hypothetical protein Q9M14_08550 [Mariprofundaceae bacterium]|nr:hypothetical protein [Mariprofundaceae bacterium]